MAPLLHSQSFPLGTSSFPVPVSFPNSPSWECPKSFSQQFQIVSASFPMPWIFPFSFPTHSQIVPIIPSLSSRKVSDSPISFPLIPRIFPPPSQLIPSSFPDSPNWECGNDILSTIKRSQKGPDSPKTVLGTSWEGPGTIPKTQEKRAKTSFRKLFIPASVLIFLWGGFSEKRLTTRLQSLTAH
jgi:hypothetical protein